VMLERPRELWGARDEPQEALPAVS
jgi:hypothetical protein